RGDAAVASAAAERVLAAPAPPAQRREALEVLASASVLRGDLEAGLDALRQVAEMASGSERAGVLLRLAELLDRAGDRGEAVDVARRVVVEHPQSVAAPRALDLLHDLGASDAVSYAEAGLVRYGERSYDRAIANFDAYLAQQPDGPQAPQARYYRAMALDVQGAWEAAVAGFRELAERHPQSAWAPQGLYVAGRIFEERGDDGSAQAFYTWVLERWPASPVATDARFRLGLLQYVHGDAAGAIATWEPLTDLREEWARALLWMGKALDRMGRRDEAVAAWEQVASGPPTAYETWRARDLLADVRYPEQRLQPGGMNADQAAPPGLADPPADLDDPHVRRAVELVAVGLWDEASSEIEAALQGWSAPASVLGDLVVWLQSQGLHHLALRGAALERSDADESVRERLEAVARGVPYASLIEAAAAEEGLDPHLLAGLVRQESAFNPRAVSPARAVGLTQVMPSTGSEIAEKLDWPDYRSDDLLRPEVSLRFGAWYLARALERYDGRLFPSLAAYNAGPGTVDGWMERFGYDDPDVFVERVPWREPAQYIRKVYAWYRTFQESASPVPSADAP
ncbi:MAG TPA: transglycosylase SLT domain-containing protein, partial [Chloroflexota bacterium]